MEKGLFVDQRWVDLAPGLFDNILILRDPGLNVAYWNIHARSIRRHGKTFLVRGQSLYFFHFSGFDPQNPQALSRHQNRFKLSDLGDGKDLLLSYRKVLLQNGYLDCKNWPYSYGAVEDGTSLPDVVRPVQGEKPALRELVDNPFSVVGFKAVCETWNRPVPYGAGSRSLTRLALRIYELRPDVRAVFPDILGRDKLGYLRWLTRSGRSDYGLPEPLLAPFHRALREYGVGAGGLGVSAWSDSPFSSASDNDESPGEWLDRFTGFIWESRPDVKARFAEPLGQDCLPYLAWLYSYGRWEYGLAPEDIIRVETEWKSQLSKCPSRTQVWWYRILRRTYAIAAWFRAAQLRTSRPKSVDTVPLSTRDSGISARAEFNASRRSYPLHPRSTLGINVAGYSKAEMGVGESARVMVRALRRVGFGNCVRRIGTGGVHREQDQQVQEDTEWQYGVNVIHVNADQLPEAVQVLGSEFLEDKYNVGYWAWELEEFPQYFDRAFRYVDEIWTPSRFCQDALARESRVPVIRLRADVRLISQTISGGRDRLWCGRERAVPEPKAGTRTPALPARRPAPLRAGSLAARLVVLWPAALARTAPYVESAPFAHLSEGAHLARRADARTVAVLAVDGQIAVVVHSVAAETDLIQRRQAAIARAGA